MAGPSRLWSWPRLITGDSCALVSLSAERCGRRSPRFGPGRDPGATGSVWFYLPGWTGHIVSESGFAVWGFDPWQGPLWYPPDSPLLIQGAPVVPWANLFSGGHEPVSGHPVKYRTSFVSGTGITLVCGGPWPVLAPGRLRLELRRAWRREGGRRAGVSHGLFVAGPVVELVRNPASSPVRSPIPLRIRISVDHWRYLGPAQRCRTGDGAPTWPMRPGPATCGAHRTARRWALPMIALGRWSQQGSPAVSGPMAQPDGPVHVLGHVRWPCGGITDRFPVASAVGRLGCRRSRSVTCRDMPIGGCPDRRRPHRATFAEFPTWPCGLRPNR